MKPMKKWTTDRGLIVLAHTKSEARALLKEMFSLKRLPVGFKLKQVKP